MKKSLGVSSATELDGASVCIQPGTTTERSSQDYFRSRNMTLRPVAIADTEETYDAFVSGRCDSCTDDRSSPAAFRARQGAQAEGFVILPEVISKEPLAPVVRKGDDNWFDIVRWTFFAQIAAGETGLTSQNIDSFMNTENPEIRRFLGLEGDLGKALVGLDNRWAYNIIRQVGNYGEVWGRSMGAIGVARGVNTLWTRGGLLYAPLIR